MPYREYELSMPEHFSIIVKIIEKNIVKNSKIIRLITQTTFYWWYISCILDLFFYINWIYFSAILSHHFIISTLGTDKSNFVSIRILYPHLPFQWHLGRIVPQLMQLYIYTYRLQNSEVILRSCAFLNWFLFYSSKSYFTLQGRTCLLTPFLNQYCFRTCVVASA